MFIYFWDRDRQSMNRGGSEREGGTESETGSRLWAVSTEADAGLELTNREIMTWAEVGRFTDWATQVPRIFSHLIPVTSLGFLFVCFFNEGQTIYHLGEWDP